MNNNDNSKTQSLGVGLVSSYGAPIILGGFEVNKRIKNDNYFPEKIENYKSELTDKLQNIMKTKENIHLNTPAGKLHSYGAYNPNDDKDLKGVHLSVEKIKDKNTFVLSHELGHSKNIDFLKKHKLIVPYVLSNRAYLPASLIGIVGAAVSKDDNIAKTYAVAGSGLAGLTLADEALATLKGIKGVSKMYGGFEKAFIKSGLGKGLLLNSTYIGGALAPAITYGARKLLEHKKQASYIDELQKIAEDTKTVADPFIAKRFEKIKQLLDSEGVLVGTYHKRLAIPKDKLTEEDLKTLNFLPSYIAVPESGQDRFESFRHPSLNHHIHSHPGYWTIHEDRHPSSQMLAFIAEDMIDKAKAYVEGLPHLVTEGVPGMFAYAKGAVKKDYSTAKNIIEELPGNVKRKIDRWIPSKTFTTAEQNV